MKGLVKALKLQSRSCRILFLDVYFLEKILLISLAFYLNKVEETLWCFNVACAAHIFLVRHNLETHSTSFQHYI